MIQVLVPLTDVVDTFVATSIFFSGLFYGELRSFSLSFESWPLKLTVCEVLVCETHVCCAFSFKFIHDHVFIIDESVGYTTDPMRYLRMFLGRPTR